MANIFTHNETLDGVDGRMGMILRGPEWDESANRELNTYRSFNPIALEVEPIFHGNEGNDVDFMPFSSSICSTFSPST